MAAAPEQLPTAADIDALCTRAKNALAQLDQVLAHAVPRERWPEVSAMIERVGDALLRLMLQGSGIVEAMTGLVAQQSDLILAQDQVIKAQAARLGRKRR